MKKQEMIKSIKELEAALTAKLQMNIQHLKEVSAEAIKALEEGEFDEAIEHTEMLTELETEVWDDYETGLLWKARELKNWIHDYVRLGRND